MYIFCSQLQQVSKGGVHAVPSMTFGAAQDTRPPPPSWPALSLPPGADYVFVELTIGRADSAQATISRSHMHIPVRRLKMLLCRRKLARCHANGARTDLGLGMKLCSRGVPVSARPLQQQQQQHYGRVTNSSMLQIFAPCGAAAGEHAGHQRRRHHRVAVQLRARRRPLQQLPAARPGPCCTRRGPGQMRQRSTGCLPCRVEAEKTLAEDDMSGSAAICSVFRPGGALDRS